MFRIAILVWALVARFKNLYRNSFAGIDAEIGDQVEFGLFKKLGDESTRRIPGRV